MILPTRPFRLERHMVEPLVRAVPSVLSLRTRTRTTLLQEPTIAEVIPDVLVAHWLARTPTFPTHLTFLDCSVLALLEARGPLRTEEIRGAFHLDAPTTNRTVDRLRRVHLIAEVRDRIQLATDTDSSGFELIAIEAKLRRWRQALEQAVTYRRFADRSYVALDANQVTFTCDMAAAFTESGVGLILQWGFVARIVVDAPALRPTSAERYWAAAKLSREARSR
jgi:hypothetical protein